MTLWHRLREKLMPPPEGTPSVTLTLDGWSEAPPNGEMSIWRSTRGEVLSLAVRPETLLPSFSDPVDYQEWCRDIAESAGSGLIDVQLGATASGRTISMIRKRLKEPAYIFTGTLLIQGDDLAQQWTVVSGERGTTGVREAVVTIELLQAGKLSIEEYSRSWARDPYDSAYCGVDRRVLRFVSDDELYDERFPDHPLSRVRAVLAHLKSSVGAAPY